MPGKHAKLAPKGAQYTDYTVVCGRLAELEVKICNYLAEGYVLVGGVAATQIPNEGEDFLYQAVAKPI